MKKAIILILGGAALLVSCQSFNQEPLIMGEQKIIFSSTTGIFNNAGNGAPAVLLLHGFASSKDEVGGLYTRLSDALYKQGISTLRIDFRGWGESTFPMELSSIDNMILDAREAIKWLDSRKEIGDIGIHGFSLGCGVAIYAASEYTDKIKTLGLWSCINSFEEQLLELMEIDSTAVSRAIKEGKSEFDLGWSKIVLGKDFIMSLTKYDLQKSYGQFQGEVLIIDGADDPLVTSLATYSSLAPERTTAFAIENADHIYAVFSDNPLPADQLIEKTVAWYTEKLLPDY